MPKREPIVLAAIVQSPLQFALVPPEQRGILRGSTQHSAVIRLNRALALSALVARTAKVTIANKPAKISEQINSRLSNAVP